MFRESDLDGLVSEVGIPYDDLFERARSVLFSTSCCVKIHDLKFDRGFPKVAVFWAHVESSIPDDASHVWVVVGDVPPIYMNARNHENGAEALAGYLLVLYQVLYRYAHGLSRDDCPPILTASCDQVLEMNEELADMIRRRLLLIKSGIIERWDSEIRYDFHGLNESNVMDYC